MSLAKYIDMLRTRSLYFPKAALFQDDTEGKWFGHTTLHNTAKMWADSLANADKLEGVIRRAGDDPEAILIQAALLLNSKECTHDVLRSVLADTVRIPRQKRRDYLMLMISSWRTHPEKLEKDIESWTREISVVRESTYISCWNRATSMSLAMWEMYGGGHESVAIRSSVMKLNELLERNSQFLSSTGLQGGVVNVRYLEGLKEPTEKVHEEIYEIVMESADVRFAMFRIKPSMYHFEQETRAILFPSREDIFSPITDPHPDHNGHSLSIGKDFIEEVYVHPTLSEQSMMFLAVKEINRLFGFQDVPVVADRIEAFGKNIHLRRWEG